MIADLIFDVGMNNGDDTAYYLFKGFRVVAIDADPTMIASARTRFAEPIRQGRLELVNAAVGPREETAPFWICEGNSEWNSFDRQIASRNGLSCHAIEVRCQPFRDLLRRYGVPYYLKIDIEGHDQYCIADLDRRDLPRYLSQEMVHLDDLWMLRDAGYTHFKLITQNDHSQLFIDPMGVKALATRCLRPYPRLRRAGSGLAGAFRRLRPLFTRRPAAGAPGANGPGWHFAHGSSGPFGEDTDGPWRTLEETAYTWVTYQLGGSRYGTAGLSVWHDVHAM